MSGLLRARPPDKTRQVDTRMEAKNVKRGKCVSHRSTPCREPVAPWAGVGFRAHCLKNFTIPKIRRTAEKAYLSICHTNRREYSSISHALAQCRLDLSCELQAVWQFGETQLVHNEYLERKFSAKRKEMRERGRPSHKLEEHYCFLALSHGAMSQMYKTGLCTHESTMKALGSPLLGVYVFRHADVALSYTHSKKQHVDTLMIFKVLYGKVKKIQPVVDKGKTSLDPSPNFDCHMSRLVPTPKDSIEQQAIGSAVYLYEYNTLSKPVDRPRQCLPYATITVRFLGQKGSGETITYLRFLSMEFPRWTAEERNSLNNCTIAKRIGKGKNATVIYKHFPKPMEASAQDSCSCAAEMNPLAPERSSPCGFFAGGPVDGQAEHNLAGSHNLSQVPAPEANPPLPPSVDATPSGNGDLLVNFNYLKKVLAIVSAAAALPNNVGTSTVTTSKLVKDPRLLRRRGSRDQGSPETGSRKAVPLESREECPDSQVNPSPSLPSGAMSGERMVLSRGFPGPKGLFYQNHGYGAIPEVTMADAKKVASKEVIPEHENRGCSDAEMCSSSRVNRILLPVQKQAKGKYVSETNHVPGKGVSMDTSSEQLSDFIPWRLLPADFGTVRERLQPPPLEPLQAQQETRNKFIQVPQTMKNLNADPKNHSKQGKNKYSKKRGSHDSAHGEGRSSLREFCLPHEKHKTLILSHQDGNDCKKPRSQGPDVLVQPSPSPPKQEGKSSPKHVPCQSENSYPSVSAQKSSKNCLEEWLKCQRMYIDKRFSKSPEVAELKTGSLRLIPIDMKADASQDMDVTVETREEPHELISLPLDTEVPHFKVTSDGNRKPPVVDGENENKPVFPDGPHRDGGLNACLVEEVDRSQDCTIFCDPVFGDDDTAFPDLNVCFREQEIESAKSDDPHPEREGRQSPFVEKNKMENIYVDEKQVVYMNKNCTTIVSDEREIKNLGRSAVMYSEKFSSTFNLVWKKSCVSIETALVENANRVTPRNQGGTLPGGERKPMPLASTAALAEAAGSHDLGTSVPTPAALMPGFGTEYQDDQGKSLGRAQAVQSPCFGAWARNVFGEHGGDADSIQPSEAWEQPAVGEDPKFVFPQDLDFDNEIKVESEQCEDSFLQRDTALPGHLSADDMNAVYQLLESRIDWGDLFGGSSRKPSEGSKSRAPREEESQRFLRESSCIYSCAQKNHRELSCPVAVPDLQIQIINIVQSGFAVSQELPAMQEEVLMCASPEITEVEMSDAWQESEPLAGPSQLTCENTNPPGQDELGLKAWSEASELMGNLVISPPSDSLAHKAVETSLALSPQPALASQTTKDKSTSLLAKPRDAHNRAPRVKEAETQSSKGKLPASLKDKIMPSRNFRYPEPGGITRKTTCHQSSEQFSSLSEGRIRTFSQSERHIRYVLNALYSEVSLCKSKRLSRKLDQAVLHLKKAHRRVHRSLQLVTKVGEKRRSGPLPKSYEVIRNSLWECCDLEGYDFLTERRYYSRHYWQKRKDEKREEKRASGLEMVRSRTPASQQQGCSGSSRDQGVRRPLSIEGLSSKASVGRGSIPRSTHPDRPHRSESWGSALRDPRAGADCEIPDGHSKAFPSHHSDGEGRLDFIFLSSVHTEERSERPLGAVSSREALSRVERNGKFFSSLGEKHLPLDTNQLNVEGDEETPSRENSDIFISVLKSSTEHFFSVDISNTDHLRLPRNPPNLESRLPAEKSPAASSRPSTASEHSVRGSASVAACTGQEGESVLQNFSCISVTNNEAEWQTPHSKKQAKGLPVVGSLATHTLSLRQEQPQLQDAGEDAVDAMWGPCKNSPRGGDRKEGSSSESAPVGPAPLEKNKNDEKHAVGLLLVSTSLENTRCSSSQKSTIKGKDKKRWTKPVEREPQSEKPGEESSVLPGPSEKSPVQTEGRDKQGQALDSSSVVAVSFTTKTPTQLAGTEEEEGEEGRMEVEDEASLSPSAPLAAINGDLGARRKKVPQTWASSAQQPPPASEGEEDESSENPTSLIVKLSRILQKADKASTLRGLQEQIKMCQTVLPLFVEAFERKQKCSFQHVRISRSLLVEGHGWNNCNQRLRLQAVDFMAELQMMMENLQLVENKKGLLGFGPTFRSLLRYDASLCGELHRGCQGYRRQACLYLAFQDRLGYDVFSELRHCHGQLIRLLEEARKENRSYYAVLKYQRQIEECEDVMKRCSSYFDFTLSAPFTCGVNFGGNLDDLEMLRRNTLELISIQDHFPKIQSCPGKQDHLWIIMEMISSKMHFMKNSESISVKISLYGLEHIFFDAAKSLIWKDRGLSVGKNDSPEKVTEELLVFNQCAFKKLQQIYETLEADGKAKRARKGWLEETVGNAVDIRRVGEIIDQAESADLRQLEELTVRCGGHLETLKKCFQILQEAATDSVLITEDNVLDMAGSPSPPVVVLKPEAVEMYIEVIMLAETVHFLKNVMAKKLGRPRFRGMLWFDLSLLPELIENQQKTAASCSLLREKGTACLWKAVEAAVLELKADATVVCEHPEGANSSYALQLLSRELAELSEMRTLLEQATPPIATYVDLVPHTMSVNYGMTLSELEHNYNQFAGLLESLTSASQKDLGKMAHIMKVMKTIRHLKASCAGVGSGDISLLICQMFSNAQKARQPGTETSVIAEMEPRALTGKPSPSSLPRRDRAGSRKRPFPLAPCESCRERLRSPDPPSGKKPKMGDLLTTEGKKTREPKGPLWDDREKTEDEGVPLDLVPPPHQSQSRKQSPDVSGQGSPGPNCPLPLQGPTEDRGPAGPQGSLAGVRGRGLRRSLRKRSSSEGTLPGALGLPPHTAARLRPGADALQAAPRLAGASFRSEANLCSAAVAEDSGLVRADHEMLMDGSGGVILPGHEALVLQPTLPGLPIPPQPGPGAEPPNQAAPGSHGVCSFSQQLQQPENAPGVFVPAPGVCWNGQGPQAWGHAYSPIYPHSSWCIDRYCNSNGSSVTQTDQGVASCEGQPLPAAVAPFCHAPAGLLGRLGPRDPPRSGLGPPPGQGLGFCASHGPLACPATPCTASQAPRHAPYPCPLRPGLFPGVTCTSAPWQQGSFQNGH
ncbi:LOW QUALITY PROTEIN: testis-expressed protein 15 [Phascolarctos cinereus]